MMHQDTEARCRLRLFGTCGVALDGMWRASSENGRCMANETERSLFGLYCLSAADFMPLKID